MGCFSEPCKSSERITPHRSPVPRGWCGKCVWGLLSSIESSLADFTLDRVLATHSHFHSWRFLLVKLNNPSRDHISVAEMHGATFLVFLGTGLIRVAASSKTFRCIQEGEIVSQQTKTACQAFSGDIQGEVCLFSTVTDCAKAGKRCLEIGGDDYDCITV